jgi:hypothetical protein
MRWRVIMILAGGALSVSLLATDAQARGTGGYGGARAGDYICGLGGGRIGVFDRGQMAGIHRHFGTGSYYPLILGIGY